MVDGMVLNCAGKDLNSRTYFFAYDIILFGEATLEQPEEMTRCLNLFCESSGQWINRSKSSLFFSKNTQMELQLRIGDLTGIPKVESLGKYLGVPSIHGRLKQDSFTGLIEKVQQKLLWQADKS